MARSPAKFEVRDIEPAGDPVWQGAGEAVHRAFWRAVVAFALKAKDEELSRGLDRYGKPLAPIAASTRKYRKSAMGAADPSDPPLMPAGGVSRTRLNLTGRGFADHAEFYWTDGWGKILRYHALGRGRYGRIPVRDVIGLSPESLRKVRGWSLGWWITWKRTHSLSVARKPLAANRTAPERMAVVGRTDYENFTYGIGGGSAAKSRALLVRGRASGFVQHAPPGGFEREPPVGPGNPFWKGPKPKPKAPKATKPAPVKAATPTLSLPIHIKGDVSPDCVRQAREIHAGLPERVRKALDAHGVKVVIGRSMADAAPDLVDRRPRGWPEGTTWANADGCYRAATDRREIVATEFYRSEMGNSETRSPRFPGALRHETGHAYDDALGIHSQSPEFLAAYRADVDKMDEPTRQQVSYYLQPGEAGPSETFAEIFARLVGESGTSHRDLREYFLATTELLRSLL
jgi:hypothetical protein